MLYSRSRNSRPLVAAVFIAASAGTLWLAAKLDDGLRARSSFGTAAARFLEAGFEISKVQTKPGITVDQRVPIVHYAYEVNGRRYTGRTVALPWLRWLGCATFEEQALRTAAQRVETTVRVDPGNPARSLLTLRFDAWLIAGWLALGAGIAGAAGRSFLRNLRGEGGAGGTSGNRGALPHAAGCVSGSGMLLMAVRFAAAGEGSVKAWVAALLLLVFGTWPLLRRLFAPTRAALALCVRVTRSLSRRAA